MTAAALRPAALAFTAFLGAALALSGCAGEPSPSPSAGASSTPTRPGLSPSPTPTGSPTPTTGPTSAPVTPISLPCTSVLSLQAVYDYNPNYGENPAYSPAAGSEAAAAIARGGFACGWINQTSGDSFELAVSIPVGDEDDALEAAAAAQGTPFELDDADAWFASAGGIGRAWIEVDDRWVVLSSSEFGNAADVAGLAQAAANALND